MESKYDFSQIPENWKFCFNTNCPLHEQCLRYQAATQLPANRIWGSAVFPTAEQGGRCEFFRKDEKVTLATGFVVAGQPAMSDLSARLRRSITAYLGGNGTYYLYRNGKKWLSPAQQAHIRQMFSNHGYKGEVQFSTTKETYDFT